MKTDKRIVQAILLVTLLAMISSQVSALGVGPSRQVLSFVAGDTIEGELVIINDKAEEFKVAIYPDGELSSYVKLETQLLEFTSKDSMKSVPYEINFPTSQPKPGPHKIDVVVRQLPADSTGEESTLIQANVAVISQIIIKVPYPGKYAEGKLFITGTQNTDTPSSFVVMLYNFGTEDISEAYATVQIFSPSMEKVMEFSTDKKGVRSKEEGKLSAEQKLGLAKGTYKAAVTVHYDDKEIVIEQDFDIGNFVIDISDIAVKKFRLGDVAKFDILLFNSWNTEMKDVYVEMLIEDSTGKKMTEFKTSVINIPAEQASPLEAYWYTENVAPGIYKVKLIVHYAGKITQKDYDFEVSTNSVTRLGTVGQAVTEEEAKEISMQGLLIMLMLFVIVLLIIMNFVWFYYLSKKMKNKGDEK